MKHQLHLLLIVIATGSFQGCCGEGYRLPGTQIPSSYDIKLNFPDGVFDGSSAAFNGIVTVTFETLLEIKIIHIHSPSLPRSIRVINPNSPANAMEISTSSFNAETEILQIFLVEDLKPTISYELTIEYDANVDVVDRRGVYRSKYTDSLGLRHIITTQFQPTYARKAFPCFDEPKYKANFTLSLTFPSVGFKAFSNTPSLTLDESGSAQTIQFQPTPKMSSYLVAFVISNLTCTWGSTVDASIFSTVCSRQETQYNRFFVNSNTPAVFGVLQSATGIRYSDHGIGELRQVAVPDFYAGAMENWGLPIYRESLLLWNEAESSNYFRQKVLSIVSHELAHFWFGNLVTNDWWDNLFLNEGFATYFEYMVPASIETYETDENWQMFRQFVTEQQQTALVADGYLSAKPLSFSVEKPDEIWERFDTISYSKGASILRMIENFIGTTNFLNGIKKYLKERMFDTALPSHLWESIQSEIETNLLPTTFVNFVENWISKPGYPVLTVTADGTNIRISQKRFLYNSSESDSTQWYVPISYTVASDVSQFLVVSPKSWLVPGEERVLTNILPANEWIVLNNQESAYFRVNYDSSLWERIRLQLTDNHQNINVLNRAQIMDDVFNLARAEEINYNQAFRIISYLHAETDYFPWYSAIKGFDYLITAYGENTDTGRKIIEFKSYLLQNVFHTATFSSLNAGDQIETLRLRLILGRLCRIGELNCVSNAQQSYRNYRNGVSVDKNLKSVVYCNGLRYSNDIQNDWTYLWDQLQETSLETEKREILAGLGCTRDASYLNIYLEQSLNSSSVIRLQDFSEVWSSVYNSGPLGLETALEFFVKNHVRIASYYLDSSDILTKIAGRIFSQNQLAQLETLLSITNLPDSLEAVRSTAVAAANANLVWAEKRKDEIERYFIDNPIPSTTYPTPTSTTTTTTTSTTSTTTSTTTTTVAPATASTPSAVTTPSTKTSSEEITPTEGSNIDNTSSKNDETTPGGGEHIKISTLIVIVSLTFSLVL